jgi:hypothetical protein
MTEESEFARLNKHIGHKLIVGPKYNRDAFVGINLVCRECNYEVVMVIENPEHPVPTPITSLPKDIFVIDNSEVIEGYHDPYAQWNGWRTPLFEKDALITWLKQEMNDNPKIIYDEQLDAIYCPEDYNDPDHQWAVGRDVLTVEGVKRLYATDGWCWELGPRETYECWCGHSFADHHSSTRKPCTQCSECRRFDSHP